MTLPKILLRIALITFLLFLYAHAQLSKTLLLYDIQHQQVDRVLLSDAHHLLKYQVSALTSPPSLETTLAKGDLRLEFPEDRHVIRLAMEEERPPLSKKANLLDLLSATKVAEAGSH